MSSEEISTSSVSSPCWPIDLEDTALSSAKEVVVPDCEGIFKCSNSKAVTIEVIIAGFECVFKVDDLEDTDLSPAKEVFMPDCDDNFKCSKMSRSEAVRKLEVIISGFKGFFKENDLEDTDLSPAKEVFMPDCKDNFKCSKMSRSKAVRKLEVSVSGFKRVCREDGIYGSQAPRIKTVRYSGPLPVEDQEQIPKLPSDLVSDQASACVGYINPGLQDPNMVTFKAKYGTYTLKFRLPWWSRLEYLDQEVFKRLKIRLEYLDQELVFKDGAVSVWYEDDVEKYIHLISFDQNLRDFIRYSRSLGKSTFVVWLVPRIFLKNPTQLVPRIF